MEIWRSIDGFNGAYSVSDKGRIINVKNGNYRKHVVHHSGYVHVKLGSKDITLHRIIAKAFIPNPENKPCVNHKDGNKQNNNIDNLEWCTVSENQLHAYKIGLKKGMKNNGHNNKLDEISVRIIHEAWIKFGYGSQVKIAKYFLVDHATISAVVRGVSWRTKISTAFINTK